LVDIDIPGKQTFRESDTLTAGNQVTVFETPFCKIGVAICYDIRFPELAEKMRKAGAEMFVYPGAFNTTTGPMHWELLARARAVDNQLYVACVSPSRNPDSKYQAWGHSSLVNPWGDVTATCDHTDAILVENVDLTKVREMRQSIPTSSQKRFDLY
jgi:omega-amidase